MNKWIVLILIFLIAVSGCSSGIEQTVTAVDTVLVTEEVAQSETATVLPIATKTVAVLETAAVTVTGAATNTPQVSETEVLLDIEEVIEFEMKGSFDFFWEQANTDVNSSGYGLVRDRYPGSEGISSIASVGFGLTAYLVGIEKGYITYDQGYERVNGTLDTLLGMDRQEGFFFHFVEMGSGKRAWNSEISNIDTSILLMGVLAAGEYFGGEIGTKAKQIYDGVNWPWFIDESRHMFYMAYRPEKGFEGHWDFYAEQLMLYILAAGSDTHPIDDTTYYGFIRHYGKFGAGKRFIHSWFGSIFTYQFSHAWIDFRDTVDKEGVNWFNNSVEASLAQVNFAAEMDERYSTLGPDSWGLTACDGPEGYNGLYGAPPSGYDNTAHLVDDTVPPSGAIGSIIFVPQQAERAMLHYYALEELKGDYGFLDAYNLSEDWVASDVIGINKGISLLMLANYQDDIVYEIIMKNKNIQVGLERLQITKNGQGGAYLFSNQEPAIVARPGIPTTSYARSSISTIDAATHPIGSIVEKLWKNGIYYTTN